MKPRALRWARWSAPARARDDTAARTPFQVHAATLARALAPLVGGNRVQLLQDGPETYAAMFEAIDEAREHINIESYTVESDGPGAELARRLVRRCADGVKVNLLFDGFGSLHTSKRYFDALRAAGVTVCEYNPLRRMANLLSRALHLRDHRKLMVVDGRVAFIGGVNISGVYAFGSLSGSAHREGEHDMQAARDRGWRDTHVRVEGPIVAQLQRLYVDHWRRVARIDMARSQYFPPLDVAGTHQVGVAATDAGHRRNPFYRALLGAIDAAQLRVRATTAYFVPTRRLTRALIRAARRGVQVELMLPGYTDFWAPLYAGRSHYGALLRAGVRVFERHDTLLHAKTCVIDGVWATVGSSNLDWRSMLHNAEANIVILDEDIGTQLERVFEDDLLRCREIKLETWRHRDAMHRVKEWVARRFEFFL